MGPIKLIKLIGDYNKFESINKERGSFKMKLAQYLTLAVSLFGTIGVPSLATNWLHAHLAVYAACVAVAILLHAAFPSIFSGPSDADKKATGLNNVGVALLLFGLIALTTSPKLFAQTPQSVYGAGVSFSPGASPAVAGTGLYAHALTDSAGTYAFSVVDLLPNTQPKFSVTTNFGAGIAQKILTVSNIPIYIPTSAGISLNGSNTGWAWSTGSMAVIKLKKSSNLYLMPNIRIAKSSVSGGTGYQPIVGVMVGWGQ